MKTLKRVPFAGAAESPVGAAHGHPIQAFALTPKGTLHFLFPRSAPDQNLRKEEFGNRLYSWVFRAAKMETVGSSRFSRPLGPQTQYQRQFPFNTLILYIILLLKKRAILKKTHSFIIFFDSSPNLSTSFPQDLWTNWEFKKIIPILPTKSLTRPKLSVKDISTSASVRSTGWPESSKMVIAL